MLRAADDRSELAQPVALAVSATHTIAIEARIDRRAVAGPCIATSVARGEPYGADPVKVYVNVKVDEQAIARG